MIDEDLEQPIIKVHAHARFLEEQEHQNKPRYVFAYTITIHNEGPIAATLISRRWNITNANGKTEQVQGLGVVGKQPTIDPGQNFQYTSGTVLSTPVGSMQGDYFMIADNGYKFKVKIPPFRLAVPTLVH